MIQCWHGIIMIIKYISITICMTENKIQPTYHFNFEIIFKVTSFVGNLVNSIHYTRKYYSLVYIIQYSRRHRYVCKQHIHKQHLPEIGTFLWSQCVGSFSFWSRSWIYFITGTYSVSFFLSRKREKFILRQQMNSF